MLGYPYYRISGYAFKVRSCYGFHQRYRPACSAMKDSILALGHVTGRVSFLMIDANVSKIKQHTIFDSSYCNPFSKGTSGVKVLLSAV